MTSALRGAEGGSGKADEGREVAWIYYCISDPNVDKGGKRGSKIPQIL